MRIFTLATLACLCLASSNAKADYAIKCKSVVVTDQLDANIRWAESGNSGRIEIDYWNGYPPIGLVWGEFKATGRAKGKLLFETEVDRYSKLTAKLAVKEGFDPTKDFQLEVTIPQWNKGKTSVLDCQRF